MKIGMIGLGKMGLNMCLRLNKHGHECLGLAHTEDTLKEVTKQGVKATCSLKEFLALLEPKPIVWLMTPAGKITNDLVLSLTKKLTAGSILIDGGNSHFIDSVSNHASAKKHGINFLDIGVSGGVWGLKRGYCLMIGGEKPIYEKLIPIFRALCPNGSKDNAPAKPEEGFLYCGKGGSGHYVKMIHNAIEYGMMQAMAEGFEIMQQANSKNLPETQQFDLNLKDISEVWRHGSVVSSWLLDLLAHELSLDMCLDDFKGFVPDSGEAKWALMEAIKQNTPASVLANSLFYRFRSRQDTTFAGKTLSALRKGFGGHSEK